MGLEFPRLDRKGAGGMKPNIIYIHTHDSGRYMEPYGAPVRTEHIMRFCERATLFRNAHCTGPTCSPSRSGLLTGMYSHSNGMLGLAHRGFSLNDYSWHLASYLRENGFETALSGVQHVADDKKRIGYDRLLGDADFEMSHSFSFDSEAYDKNNAHAAAAYIEEKKDCPFFLSFGMFNTHRVFPEPGEQIAPDYLSVPVTVADTAANRRDMAGFHRSMAIVDDCVGIVLDALQRSGRWEESVVIITTDHGIPFPGMKCTLSDHGTGVAFMMHIPGNPSAGKACDALISQIDLFPTLCEILNMDRPERLQGRSFLRLFRNPEEEIREEVFSEVSFHAAYEPKRAVRTREFKLIRRYDEDRSPVPANVDGCPAKQDMIDSGYFRDMIIDRSSLFDLRTDPMERNNLAGRPEYEQVEKELNRKLDDWMEETGDPLLANGGTIPIPEGGLVNRRNSLEPNEVDFI